MTNKEQVKAKYPNAELSTFLNGTLCYVKVFINGFWVTLGEGSTPRKAWQAALWDITKDRGAR